MKTILCLKFIIILIFFPIFRDLIKKNGVKNIYNKYYIPGNVYFNKEGNSVIFNHIKNIKNQKTK